MKHLILLFILIPLHIQAQYIGGSQDGDAFASTTGIRLNGSIGSFSVLYNSGNGDGFNHQMVNAVLNGNILTLYQGGLGDGYSKSLNTELLSGLDISSMYDGNEGDGFSQLISNVMILNGENLTMLYSGNDGDGFALNFLTDVLLQGFMTNLYEGGIGDGYAEAILPDILLIGFMTELYEGGVGDGFSSLISSGNLINGLMFALFNGGNGDGYASDILNTSITLDVIEVLVKLNILLYPNPASDIVNIKPSNGVNITSIQLFDISGNAIKMELSNKNTINVGELSDGIYLLNIFSDSGSVSKRLIVKK